MVFSQICWKALPSVLTPEGQMVNQRDRVPGSELRLLDRVMVTDR